MYPLQTVPRISRTFMNHHMNTIRFLNNIMLIIVIQLCPISTLNERSERLITNRAELNKVALKGSHLELPCFTSFSKSPEALFQWKKDGSFLVNTRNAIPRDSRLSISISNGSLKIVNVSYHDEGLYLCETFDSMETTLLRITLYVIESHPRHYHYHSQMIRAHHNHDENVAYHLPLVGISLVVLLFLFINCYKRDSVPNIPDYTETSLIDQLFSRAFRKYQSFLLPKMHHRPDKSPNPIHNPSHQYHHGPIVNPYPFDEDLSEYKITNIDEFDAKKCDGNYHQNQQNLNHETTINNNNQPQQQSQSKKVTTTTTTTTTIDADTQSNSNQSDLLPILSSSTMMNENTINRSVKDQYCHYQGPVRIAESNDEESLPPDISTQLSPFFNRGHFRSSKMNSSSQNYPPIRYFDSVIVYCPDKGDSDETYNNKSPLIT
ncbi:uncharacterized protein LOC141853315 [Brevipalpus obovatus]|uniref:uncharacterized protein LOC141853315 n=1 Tax=Brevipalpus obovatus TaxID=246614 RepID=UPI003D9DF15B